MAIASGCYLETFKRTFNNGVWTTGGPFDYDGNTINGALVTDSATNDFDSSTLYLWSGGGSEVTNEPGASGTYSSGGSALTSKSIEVGATGGGRSADVLYWVGSIAAWTGATLSAEGLIVYNASITSPDSPMICCIDFGSTVASTAGTYTVTLDTDGFIAMDLVP